MKSRRRSRSAKNPPQASAEGCGTGAAAVRLASLGIHATLLDSSPTMLALAERAVVDAGVTGKISFKHGDDSFLQTFPESVAEFDGREYSSVI